VTHRARVDAPHASHADQRLLALLRLLSTFCGGKVRRTYLEPEEVARVFMSAQRGGLADGLFLTSGVPGRPSKMTDRMLAAVDLLRRREGFRGYVH